MPARRLDGKAIAQQIQSELREKVSEFALEQGFIPALAAILVGDDPASQVYVRNKQLACERVGIASQLHRLAADASEEQLLELVGSLNRQHDVHGILVQLPLPKSIQTTRILDAVHPFKDVDAFHPENVGLLSQGRPRFLPCTPHGVLQVLHRERIPVAGKHVVIVGRSDIVGKPLAMLLQAKDSPLGSEMANATVTVCHSQTRDLSEQTRQADILIAAIGRARFITGDMVRQDAVVVDVGINRTEQGLAGDVDAESVSQVASAITPVPGGIGPLTVTMLLANTLRAAELIHYSTRPH
ncbi:MAG: bifunctional methylenetetrahydrofolate dehydrogenase/methenyltetrahydrofolate cyclohydrolase FolD [Planctomycetes bacterium]|nr:bifunctional methylenetetrahydrofolate dehydrogenase/methenyltetrahydrofolate cyclohydrolase FolD [Planctomycetota bacterium]